jgi:glucokinase
MSGSDPSDRVRIDVTTPQDSFAGLAFRSGRPLVGVDVGGTTLKIATTDASGQVVELRSEPTRIGTGEGLIEQLVRVVERSRESVQPAAMGVHVPGTVDEGRGILLRAENLGIVDLALRDRLAAATGVSVAFGNDARGAGYAEFCAGAAQDVANAVVIAIGTGIGAAVKVDGRQYDADGYGMEIGHMRMVPPGSADGVACACGGFGCLETYASAGGIARAYGRATGETIGGAEEVFARARQGDAAARAVTRQAIDMLALAIAQLASTLAPEVVVLAGGLSKAGSELFEPLAETVDQLLTFHRRPVLRRAWFGSDAGVVASLLRADELADRQALLACQA